MYNNEHRRTREFGSIVDTVACIGCEYERFFVKNDTNATSIMMN